VAMEKGATTMVEGAMCHEEREEGAERQAKQGRRGNTRLVGSDVSAQRKVLRHNKQNGPGVSVTAHLV